MYRVSRFASFFDQTGTMQEDAVHSPRLTETQQALWSESCSWALLTCGGVWQLLRGSQGHCRGQGSLFMDVPSGSTHLSCSWT